jgi:hypothetical protein
MVEIPACIPDDLQLHDGFKVPSGKLSSYWGRIFHEIHERGELFTLIFHSELASLCVQPLRELLLEITSFTPSVWIARMNEIGDWWLRKSNFNVEIGRESGKTLIRFACTDDATILVRGLEIAEPHEAWDNQYDRLFCKEIRLDQAPLPFIGLAGDIPAPISSFLQNQGYIVVMDGSAGHCATILDQKIASTLHSEVDIVNYIESSSNPLIRFGRWPNGAKSAFSVTGDIDALSLLDYADRFFHIR